MSIHDDTRFTAECTWGFAEDVVIHDTFAGIYLGMRTAQAKHLVMQLQRAIARADAIQKDYEAYVVLEQLLDEDITKE